MRWTLSRLVSLITAAAWLPLLSYGAGMGAAVGDRATTLEGVSVPVSVLSNDLGFGNPVTVAVATPPTHGTAVISGSPGPAGPVLATYTPAAGFTGTDSFVYSVMDGESNSSATVTVTVLADGDHDGVANLRDNCTQVANANQCDSDGDGYGNRCDGDLNNNTVTNSQDYVLFRQQLGKPSIAPTYNAADLNCNTVVNSQDYVLFRGLLGTQAGPSGLRNGSGYVVGGTVSGLSGAGLVLQNSGTYPLAVSGNGPFAFATGVAGGSPYSVTVLTQPSNPSQTCAVTSPTGSGTVGTGTAPNVLVTCTTNSLPLSLNISGRIPSTDALALRNDASTVDEQIAVSGNGAISFPTALVSGSRYTITVAGNPKNFDQTCVIPGGGTGTLGTAVTITVSCTTNGKFYYAVNTFTSKISTYSLNSTTGALSFVRETTTSTAPTWVEADPTGRFAYVTSKGSTPGSAAGLVSFYEINPDNGVLTFRTTIPAGRDPRHITLDRTATNAWVPNYVDDTISSYRLSSTGTPTVASAPVLTGDGPEDVDILTAQDAAGTQVNAYAYVTVSNGDIWTYAINANGTLTEVTDGIIYSGTGTPPILVIP